MLEKLKIKLLELLLKNIFKYNDNECREKLFDYGNYEETDDRFFNDKEEMFCQVIEELNNRINNIK